MTLSKNDVKEIVTTTVPVVMEEMFTRWGFPSDPLVSQRNQQYVQKKREASESMSRAAWVALITVVVGALGGAVWAGLHF